MNYFVEKNHYFIIYQTSDRKKILLAEKKITYAFP